MTAYYNSANWFYACLTAGDDGSPLLEVHSCDGGRRALEFTGWPAVDPRVEMDGPELRFSVAGPDGRFERLPQAFPSRVLSDENATRISGDLHDA